MLYIFLFFYLLFFSSFFCYLLFLFELFFFVICYFCSSYFLFVICYFCSSYFFICYLLFLFELFFLLFVIFVRVIFFVICYFCSSYFYLLFVIFARVIFLFVIKAFSKRESDESDLLLRSVSIAKIRHECNSNELFDEYCNSCICSPNGQYKFCTQRRCPAPCFPNEEMPDQECEYHFYFSSQLLIK